MTTTAIIGGGLSGTLTAINLLKKKPDHKIILIEKDLDAIGRGAAYAIQSPFHLLNVRANKMSLFQEEPLHFCNWLSSKKYSFAPDSFVPRVIFGEYLSSMKDEAFSQNSKQITTVFQEVSKINKSDGLFKITLNSETTLSVENLVLALGNIPPKPLTQLKEISGTPQYFANPWQLPEKYFEGKNSVCLIGTGLSAIDVIVNLLNSNFKGKIHAISRRGLLPQPHTNQSNETPPTHPLLLGPLSQKIHILRNWFSNIETDWQIAFDTLRPDTSKIWGSLKIAEQKRFMRHLMPYWDTHRHRLAPQLYALVSNAIQEEKFEIHAGRILSAKIEDGSVNLSYRPRATIQTQELKTDLVINCTGPSYLSSANSSLVTTLIQSGLATSDDLGLGFQTSEKGNLINKSKQIEEKLWTLGSTRKGTLWESNALLEIRMQANEIVKNICSVDLKSH